MTRLDVLITLLLATSQKKAASGLKTAGETGMPGFAEISPEEAKQYMETNRGYALIDVRMPEEFAQGHIPGAINIPLETIVDEKPETLKEAEQVLLLYCHGGSRSKKAAERLVRMGYTKVYCFGGIDTWKGSIVK